MSSSGIETAPTLPLPDAGVGTIRARTWTAVVVHGVVDFFSCILVPLMPILAERLQLTSAQVALTIALGSVSSGLIQPVVAWASDRLDTRWLGTIGFMAAVVSFSLLGHVNTYPQLLLVQLVGAAGIGAFHPVAAAAVGHLSGRKRSLGVAVFFLGGMVGGTTGSLVSPLYVKHLGLGSLAYLIGPGLAAVCVLAWAIHSVGHGHRDAHRDHHALPRRERRWRWISVWILYAGSVLRFTVNTALVQLIIEWTQRHTLARAGAVVMTRQLGQRAADLNGPMQAAMQVGMGAAGIGAGFLLARGTERRALTVVPIVGAVAVAAFPFAVLTGSGSGAPMVAVAMAFVLILISGIGFGGVVPVSISLAQRLLPHRTSLASGIMMGGAWSLAALGPPMAEALTRTVGLRGAFLVTAGFLLASGLLSLALPRWLMRKL
jgi:FSR family fosmidomycin resistance protein-like MFS transporter